MGIIPLDGRPQVITYDIAKYPEDVWIQLPIKYLDHFYSVLLCLWSHHPFCSEICLAANPDFNVWDLDYLFFTVSESSSCRKRYFAFGRELTSSTTEH